MAGRGRWLGALTQWILVPAALGATGYYLIAPQLSSIPPPIKPPEPASVAPEVTTESAPQPTGRSFAPPEVEVSTSSSRRPSAEDRPRRRRSTPRKETPKPAEDPAPKAEPPAADPPVVEPPATDPPTSTTEPTLPPPVR